MKAELSLYWFGLRVFFLSMQPMYQHHKGMISSVFFLCVYFPLPKILMLFLMDDMQRFFNEWLSITTVVSLTLMEFDGYQICISSNCLFFMGFQGYPQ